MKTRILLILCLTGNVFAENPPDVDCTVIHLKYVECLWNRSDVNYTFYSKFPDSSFRECDSYIIRDNNNGCQQPEDNLKSRRFNTFQTKLEWGEKNERIQEHKLKTKVKLYPPTNLTVQYRPDSHLWFEWRQIFTHCVESEVRYRVNDEDWEKSTVASSQEYCINLPSNSSLYELQVRSRVSYSCGQSEEWSDWSQPVLWGNRSITDLARAPLPDSPMVWHVVLYCVGGATLLLLLVMLLHNERIRIILIPVVPKPSLVPHDLQEWLDSSKGLKEVFKTNHLERTCSVREYCPVSTSDSESSDSSSISVCTDQTNCYGPVPNPDPNDARPYSNAEFVPTEEQHGKHSEVNIVDQ